MSKELMEKAIVGIQEAYGVNREAVEKLIELTNANGKVRFVSMKVLTQSRQIM